MGRNTSTTSTLAGRMYAFRKRWNIPTDDEAEVVALRNRILTVTDTHIGRFVLEHPDASRKLAYRMGVPCSETTVLRGLTERTLNYMGEVSKDFRDKFVYSAVASAKTRQALITTLQSIFWTLEDMHFPGLTDYAFAVRDALLLSRSMHIRLAVRGSHVTLYPAGVRLLDDAVVNDVLEWLQPHREVARLFEAALASAADKDENARHDTLDNLRRTLEQLLRAILGNRRSIEKQAEPLGE